MTARRKKTSQNVQSISSQGAGSRMVFVLKLIAIQGLLKGDKLSIIKNKMQKVCSIAIEWLPLRPLYLKQAKNKADGGSFGIGRQRL